MIGIVVRQIHGFVSALLALVLTSCAPNEGDVVNGTQAPESAVAHITIQRKFVGNIVSIDTGDTQSIVQTDDGYKFSVTGKFEDGVHAGDWVEVIITDSGKQFLCTKYTDYCREILSAHKFMIEPASTTGY